MLDPKYAEMVRVNEQHPGTLNADGSVNMAAFKKNFAVQWKRRQRRENRNPRNRR